MLKLGEGYAQRFTFGLQAQSESWRLQFRNRSNAERTLIRAYLRGARGVESFQWTDPRSGAAGQYVCSEWSIEYRAFNSNDISATFRRVTESSGLANGNDDDFASLFWSQDLYTSWR